MFQKTRRDDNDDNGNNLNDDDDGNDDDNGNDDDDDDDDWSTFNFSKFTHPSVKIVKRWLQNFGQNFSFT